MNQPKWFWPAIETTTTTEIEKWVVSLEQLANSNNKENPYQLIADIQEKLEKEKYMLLIREIFKCLNETGDIEYFKLFVRIDRVLSPLDRKGLFFSQYTDHELFNFMFRYDGDTNKEIVKSVINTIEIDDKKYNIDDFFLLAEEVQDAKDMIVELAINHFSKN